MTPKPGVGYSSWSLRVRVDPACCNRSLLVYNLVRSIRSVRHLPVRQQRTERPSPLEQVTGSTSHSSGNPKREPTGNGASDSTRAAAHRAFAGH